MRHKSYVEGGNSAERAKTKNIKVLKGLAEYLSPYKWGLVGALVALVIAASTVLSIGQGLRFLVDDGFGSSDAALLDKALLVLLGVVVLLAIATYARFYLISWVGERVVADIRKKVFDHVIRLDPGFFEVTRTGEVLSRLTTDTTLLQVVVGSTVSVALRNILLLIGGLILLAVTSPKLTGFVMLFVPLIVAPIVIIGRIVRRRSRTAQDRVADISAYASESLDAVHIRWHRCYWRHHERRRSLGLRILCHHSGRLRRRHIGSVRRPAAGRRRDRTAVRPISDGCENTSTDQPNATPHPGSRGGEIRRNAICLSGSSRNAGLERFHARR